MFEGRGRGSVRLAMARSNIEIPDPGVTRSLNPSQTSQKFMVPGIACIHIYIYIYIYMHMR